MVSKTWSIGLISLALLFITSSSTELLIQQVTEGRGTATNSSYSLISNLGVTRVLRDEPPSSKLLTITRFSVVKNRGEPYVSSVFEAAGYKWILVLHVNGNKKDGGNNHISLYARIEGSESLPRGWEVNVDLKLFVYNGKENQYLTVTDGTVKRYTNANKELGFGQLISLTTFHDPTQGYLEQDTASFGAEISIVKPTQLREQVTFISNPQNNVFTWKLHNFSTLVGKTYYSDEFLVEDRYWKLGFNPKGDKDRFPIFLHVQGHLQEAVATSTWADFNLKLKNQRNSNHRQAHVAAWFPRWKGKGVGTFGIVSLSDLKDTSKGYLVNDTIIFEVEMVQVSVTIIVSA